MLLQLNRFSFRRRGGGIGGTPENKSSCPASEEEEKIVSWDNLGEGLRDLRELISAFQKYFWGRRRLVDAFSFEAETVDQPWTECHMSNGIFYQKVP